MGGAAVVIIGYEVNNSAMDAYIEQHKQNLNLDPKTKSIRNASYIDYRKLLRHFEEVTSTQITLAHIDGPTGNSTYYYLCCFTDSTYNFMWNCEDVMKRVVPEKFTEVIAPLGTDHIVKRVFASCGVLFSFDVDGNAV
ncbi:hypothetical protein BD410DRAFT_792587 [Rickenella mellea]|uniref:Uncharacterized protein n=1 Tax=Rickenella mellea TaxID=50990 RepID=A0A4Y7PV23_9AGAM|nr:hypothetical protein BD410DRAFT_792587 [Rickenella mellea]